MLKVSTAIVLIAIVMLSTGSLLTCLPIATVPDKAQNVITGETSVKSSELESITPQLIDEPLPDNSGSSADTYENTLIDLQYLVNADPATVKTLGLPVSRIEELHTTGAPRIVDIEQYQLIVDGLVENELSLTYDQIKAYTAITHTVLLICPNFFVDNAVWTGVPVSTLLNEAKLKPEAKNVRFIAMDGYGEDLSIAEAFQEGVFLAYEVNGQVLPPEHGFPLRLVAKGKYGYSWVKWIRHIELIK